MKPDTDPSERDPASVRLVNVSNLRLEDFIEATRLNEVRHCGREDGIAPGMGVIWINEGPLRVRRMLDTCDYDIRLVWD